MKFYTNFFRRGDTVYVRQVEDGVRSNVEFDVTPVAYIPTLKPTDHKSVYGAPVAEISFTKFRDANEFAKNSDQTVFGFNRPEYEVIFDNYGEEYDESKIRVIYLDIETEIGEGFTYPHTPTQPINAISLSYNAKLIQFGWYDYKHVEPGVTFIHCSSEREMLAKFILLIY